MDVMLGLAKRVTDVTDSPVVGGIADALHGWDRYARDIDIYTADFQATHQKLPAAGIPCDAARREHLIQGVAIHMVADDSRGGPPKHIRLIQGVRVIALADLIRGKLAVGLENINWAKDLADVVELIRAIPLAKDFAPNLPKHLRAPFTELVDQVLDPRRTPIPPREFWKRYAS